MKPYDQKESHARLERLSGWSIEGDHLKKTFKLPSFRQAIAFVQAMADLAEAADHHPNFSVAFREVAVELWTHVAGGLTEKDFALAEKLDRISV